MPLFRYSLFFFLAFSGILSGAQARWFSVDNSSEFENLAVEAIQQNTFQTMRDCADHFPRERFPVQTYTRGRKRSPRSSGQMGRWSRQSGGRRSKRANRRDDQTQFRPIGLAAGGPAPRNVP